ncbi:hypothetical protein PXO_06046 [Xanthomonas oryzae pv. oryzae PXO99A]|uniref:Uncharacterized protein n=1 Tax=Xanthomonas oryzae pv. oryzae (strain PXO99A) TaxID=360094 RepID=A0A0K0GQG8_XANOP|nr:hypothetical protein PXO_06046 [Xanthomonas oryzae pv. oryzae PXO99A]RBL02593.1 hypothetical protein BRN27_07270 [Xanthomonas oryzae pv. oryzae]
MVHRQQVGFGHRGLCGGRGQHQRRGEHGGGQERAAGDPARQRLHGRQDSLRVSARTQSR